MESNQDWLIDIGGLDIKNDRTLTDCAFLSDNLWRGMIQGDDDYPAIVACDNGTHDYCIAGGNDIAFRATQIEIYGVFIF